MTASQLPQTKRRAKLRMHLLRIPSWSCKGEPEFELIILVPLSNGLKKNQISWNMFFLTLVFPPEFKRACSFLGYRICSMSMCKLRSSYKLNLEILWVMENGSNRRFILLYFIIITKTRVRVCVCLWLYVCDVVCIHIE